MVLRLAGTILFEMKEICLVHVSVVVVVVSVSTGVSVRGTVRVSTISVTVVTVITVIRSVVASVVLSFGFGFGITLVSQTVLVVVVVGGSITVITVSTRGIGVSRHIPVGVVPRWVISVSSVVCFGIGFGIGFGFGFSITFDESVDVVEEGGSISGGVSLVYLGISITSHIRGGISGLVVPAWVVSISSVEDLGIGFSIGFGFGFSVTFDESVEVVVSMEGGGVSGGVSLVSVTGIRGGISGLVVPAWVVSISSVENLGIGFGIGFGVSFSFTFEYSWVSHIRVCGVGGVISVRGIMRVGNWGYGNFLFNGFDSSHGVCGVVISVESGITLGGQMKAFGEFDGGRIIRHYSTIGVSDHELGIGLGLSFGFGSGKRQERCNDL